MASDSRLEEFRTAPGSRFAHWKGMKPASAVTWVFWVQAVGLQIRARETKKRGQGDVLFFLGPMDFPSLSVGEFSPVPGLCLGKV